MKNKAILIYGSTRERAIVKFNEIVNTIECIDIIKLICSVYNYSVELTNGDMYIAVGATEGQRGMKWSYAYIDKDIKKDIVHKIILPCFIPLDQDCISDRLLTDYYELY